MIHSNLTTSTESQKADPGWLDTPNFSDEDYALLSGREAPTYQSLYLAVTWAQEFMAFGPFWSGRMRLYQQGLLP